MRINGSGNKRNEEHRVSISLRGMDSEIVRTIDELDRLASETGSPLLRELSRAVNFWSGTLVDLPAPVLEIKI